MPRKSRARQEGEGIDAQRSQDHPRFNPRKRIVRINMPWEWISKRLFLRTAAISMLRMHPLLARGAEIRTDPEILSLFLPRVKVEKSKCWSLYDLDEYPSSARLASHWSAITPMAVALSLSLSYFRAAQTRRLSIDRGRKRVARRGAV